MSSQKQRQNIACEHGAAHLAPGAFVHRLSEMGDNVVVFIRLAGQQLWPVPVFFQTFC